MAVVSTGRPAQDGSRSACALRLCRSVAGAPAYGTHASDPGTPRLDRASGCGRRHLRWGRRHASWWDCPRAVTSLHAAWLVFRHPGVRGDDRPSLAAAGRSAPRARGRRRPRRRDRRHQLAGVLWLLPRRPRSSLKRRPHPRCCFAWARPSYGCDIRDAQEIIPLRPHDAPPRRAGLCPRADQRARHHRHGARPRRRASTPPARRRRGRIDPPRPPPRPARRRRWSTQSSTCA